MTTTTTARKTRRASRIEDQKQRMAPGSWEVKFRLHTKHDREMAKISVPVKAKHEDEAREAARGSVRDQFPQWDAVLLEVKKVTISAKELMI